MYGDGYQLDYEVIILQYIQIYFLKNIDGKFLPFSLSLLKNS